jgi:NAD(P)-dependent dehydrogenase (short-subunit alcohol dehydrogenase family)
VTNTGKLDGQVAIITGAAKPKGIGRGIAEVLSEAGARIVIGDILDASDTVEALRIRGGNAISMIVDTSSSQDACSLVEQALKEYGRLDILVNCAAIDSPGSPDWSNSGPTNAWDLTDDLWKKIIDVNLSGAFYCSRAALKPMLKAGSGSIVNISSISALLGAKGMPPAYNASKAGMLGLTVAFSSQVAEKGVRVNAIMPSWVDSRDDFEYADDVLKAKLHQYPLGPGIPRDIGEATLYLVSPSARWVSGTILQMTGGNQRATSIV